VLIAIATCCELPDGDEDALLLGAALNRVGIGATWCVWDDETVAWSGFDLVVIRSTWDYTRDRRAFLRWAASVPVLLNPADVISWNTDKTYLRDLAEVGLPVVPTTWFEPGTPIVAPTASEFVVKPSVGAGSKGAGRFTTDDLDQARTHAHTLHLSGRTVMIQPYIADVDTAGETALIYVEGTFSHAVAKSAMLPAATVNDLDVQYSRSLYVDEKISSRQPDAAELVIGSRTMDYVRDRFGRLLYARVDLLPTPSGPVIIELELVEPSLFLEFAEPAADALAEAIARRVGSLSA
jgi:hypothetical protein